MPASATYFSTADEFRAWLERHHATADEVWVGFFKKTSGKAGLTYADALNEALCFGWIDGRLQRVDEERYRQRFTPRRQGSHWSAVNIRRAEALVASGRMQPAGLAAFGVRRQAPAPYSYENRHRVGLDRPHEERFRAKHRAWTYFEKQPPWYRHNTQWWVMSAKKEETRQRRLDALIEACAAGERLRQFTLEPGGRKPSR